MNIKLTSIPVIDPIKAFKFYTSILGFEELMYNPEAFLAIVVSPENKNGTALLLEPVDDDIYKPFQQSVFKKELPVIILGCTDVQKEYDRLLKLGVVFKTPPTKSEYGTFAIFNDTCGNFIQIHQD